MVTDFIMIFLENKEKKNNLSDGVESLCAVKGAAGGSQGHRYQSLIRVEKYGFNYIGLKKTLGILGFSFLYPCFYVHFWKDSVCPVCGD